MHINPDRPKQGFGSTTDGNSSRKFFSDPSTASRATGIDQELIKMFSVLLFVLASGQKVNIDNFEVYCKRTLSHYRKLYSWHELTPTVHKVLEHSAVIMNHSLLPMGQLSEEAQEARNKDVRNYREFFCRKSSRTLNMKDLFCRLLLTSDPVISSARKLPTKNIRKLSPEIKIDLKDILIPHEIEVDTLDGEDIENEDTEESNEEISSDSDF